MDFDFEKAFGIGVICLSILVPSCTGVVEVANKNKQAEISISKTEAVVKMVEAGADPLNAKCAVDYNEPMCSIKASK